RLPFQAVFHTNTYKDDSVLKDQLQTYEEETAAYYSESTGGKRTAGWVRQMMSSMAQPKRTYMKNFISSKRLNNK
ncbi:NADPH-dependent oxidoreductase, partial [Fictibacillus aquaticus]